MKFLFQSVIIIYLYVYFLMKHLLLEFLAETQFVRVLWENLGVKLNDGQMQSLRQKYDLKGEGRMNYRLFCEIINQPFNPNTVGVNPANQKIEAPEL